MATIRKEKIERYFAAVEFPVYYDTPNIETVGSLVAVAA